jgi:hypothetical protein
MAKASWGHTLTQAPQSVHSSLAFANFSSTAMAPNGQDFSQRPQALHLSESIRNIFTDYIYALQGGFER